MTDHDNVMFIVTSRSIFKMNDQRVQVHVLLPLSSEDVKSLLEENAGSVVGLDEHLDNIVKLAYPLPECIIQIADLLNDYEPSEMVEVLERSRLSICSDEAYSNKERLSYQLKKDFGNLPEKLTEFLNALSFTDNVSISAKELAAAIGMLPGKLKQDFLMKFQRRGLMTNPGKGTYVQAEGCKDLSVSLIGDEKHMEPGLKRDPLSLEILKRLREVGLSVTEDPELELDKNKKMVQDLRDKLFFSVQASWHGGKLKHLEEAINIATEILKTFVTERECIKFKKEASALVEQSMKESQRDAKSLSPETKRDKMPVQVDDCSSTPGQKDICGESRDETNGRLISGPISSFGEQQSTSVLQPQDDVQSHPEVAKGLQPTESAGKSEFSNGTTGDQSTRLKIANQDYKCQVKPLTHPNPRNMTSTNYQAGTGNRSYDYDQTDDVPFNGVHGTQADRQGYHQGSPAFTGSTDSHYLRKQRENGDLYRQYGDQTDQARRLQGEHQYDNQTNHVDQPSGHEHLQRKPVDHFYRGGNGIHSAIPHVFIPRLNLDQLNDPSVNEQTWKDGLQHQHMTEHQQRNDNISSRASPPVLNSSTDAPGFSYDLRPLQTNNRTMVNGTRQLEEQTVAQRIKEIPQDDQQVNPTDRQITNESIHNPTQPCGPRGIVPPDNRFLYEQGMPYIHSHARAQDLPNRSAGHEQVPSYPYGTSPFQAHQPGHAVAYTGQNGAAAASFMDGTPSHRAQEPHNMVINLGNNPYGKSKMNFKAVSSKPA
ncbi:uncharacterized protein [Ptychodera flava]|uniref:uncharacterized protein isoform X2 n=1 Tax=Ptychodera flava TaxID=63121 RepID=UPI003969C073